jgi:hypothetical protein
LHFKLICDSPKHLTGLSGEDKMKQIVRLLAATAVSLVMAASVVLPAMADQQQAPAATTSVSAHGWHGPQMARVKVWSARIRSCPSTNCRQIGSLRYGTPVHVFVRVGGWSSIGPGKWVASYLLRS